MPTGERAAAARRRAARLRAGDGRLLPELRLDGRRLRRHRPPHPHRSAASTRSCRRAPRRRARSSPTTAARACSSRPTSASPGVNECEPWTDYDDSSFCREATTDARRRRQGHGRDQRRCCSRSRSRSSYVTSRPPSGTQEVVAEFRNAFPLIEGMHVRVDGAIAGSVGTIEVNDEGLAAVTLLVDDGDRGPDRRRERRDPPGRHDRRQLRRLRPRRRRRAAARRRRQADDRLRRQDRGGPVLEHARRAALRRPPERLRAAGAGRHQADPRRARARRRQARRRPQPGGARAAPGARRRRPGAGRGQRAERRAAQPDRRHRGRHRAGRRPAGQLERLIESLGADARGDRRPNCRRSTPGSQKLPATVDRAESTLAALTAAATATTPLAEELASGAPAAGARRCAWRRRSSTTPSSSSTARRRRWS